MVRLVRSLRCPPTPRSLRSLRGNLYVITDGVNGAGAIWKVVPT